MRVHSSALKHGLAADDIVQAASWPLQVEPLDVDERPYRELRLGFDTRARLLETVVLHLDDGVEMVIRAIPARRQYWSLLP